jgi:hypothetical protein
MSNGLTESQIRPLVRGRKNWLSVGNERSTNTAALLSNLMQWRHINRSFAAIHSVVFLWQHHHTQQQPPNISLL